MGNLSKNWIASVLDSVSVFYWFRDDAPRLNDGLTVDSMVKLLAYFLLLKERVALRLIIY